MPLSIIIEKEQVESVNESAVKGIRGIWINADVKVFIPYEILPQGSEIEDDFIPQEEARELFFKLEELKSSQPFSLEQWEINFIEGMSEWFDKGMQFSRKQKARIKSIAEIHKGKFKTKEQIKAETVREYGEDIPF